MLSPCKKESMDIEEGMGYAKEMLQKKQSVSKKNRSGSRKVKKIFRLFHA